MTSRNAFETSVTAVGFEPTPLRTGALSQRLRPLGQTVLFVESRAPSLAAQARINDWLLSPILRNVLLRGLRQRVIAPLSRRPHSEALATQNQEVSCDVLTWLAHVPQLEAP